MQSPAAEYIALEASYPPTPLINVVREHGDCADMRQETVPRVVTISPVRSTGPQVDCDSWTGFDQRCEVNA